MLVIDGFYMVSGRYVKVVGLTATHAEVKWGHNGQTPKRQSDRFISLNLWWDRVK